MVRLLTRPARLHGFGDGGGLDFSTLPDLPTTASGAVDWSQIQAPVSVSASDYTLPQPAGGAFDLATFAKSIVGGAQTYYGAQTAIQNAEAAANLAKARNQAAIAITKAGGQNAVKTAGAGLPSPTLLLLAGVGLAAVVLLKK